MTKLSNNKIEDIKISQRRYLGCKSSVLDLINEVIDTNIGDYKTFIDIFAGTGVVGHFFNNKNVRVISNDILPSNYTSLLCWLGEGDFNLDNLYEMLDELNSLNPKRNNYASENFGNRYFTVENARKIGAIREKIESYKLNIKEKSALLTSLLYAMDKVANTCGHYDSFRRKMDTNRELLLQMPALNNGQNKSNEIYSEDGNTLIRRLQADILYIDPPYNSRQYSDTYHVLDNIILWAKPPVFGVAKKYDRTAFKSNYCGKGAVESFKDLIMNANVKHILFSYNNMGDKGNARSNAVMSDLEIKKVLKMRGRVKVFEKNHNQFTAGKSNIDEHTERVFWCKVDR